ncbi:MAG: GNAT family N-acetyltransferase, partial [Candidatus Heimdallarchaeota archaeon]
KGIGTTLFQHGVEKAKERKCSVVAYATEESNYGSCKIGEKLGFQLVTSMNPLRLKLDDIVLAADKELKHQPISVDEVFEIMNSIPNGPDEEVCLGWEFVPKDKSIFADKRELKFFAVEKTLLLEHKVDNKESKEGSFAKAIIYGAEKHVKELLEEFVRRNSSNEFLNCVINEELEHIPKEMGFTNYTNADGTSVKTLLWKMKLV